MRPRILVVDDEPLVARVVACMLDDDFDVDTVCSAIEALAAIGSRGPYAAVLSDMQMPYMDGATFLKRAYELAPATPRLLLTGYQDPGLVRRTITEGRTFRYLTKPCPRDVIRAAIQEAVKEHEATCSLLCPTSITSASIEASEITSPAVYAVISAVESIFRSVLPSFQSDSVIWAIQDQTTGTSPPP